MKTVTLATRHQGGLQNAASTAAPIDTEALFARCMGNVAFALTLLSELEANGKQQMDAIVRHVANDDLYAVAEAAHSLKGAAAIIVAEPLRGKAAEIEAAGRDGEASLLLDLVRDLCSEMDRCLAYIPTVRTETQRH